MPPESPEITELLKAWGSCWKQIWARVDGPFEYRNPTLLDRCQRQVQLRAQLFIRQAIERRLEKLLIGIPKLQQGIATVEQLVHKGASHAQSVFPRNLRRIVTGVTSRAAKRADDRSVEHLSRAVSAVSRYVPQATCLTALALHIVLKRAGLQSRIRIGVAKEGGKIEAHAWVESQDMVVIGNYELARYTPIMVWD